MLLSDSIPCCRCQIRLVCIHWANPQCIMKDRSSDQHVLNAGSTQVRAREEARTASEDGTQGSSQPCARFKSNVESCWSTSLYPATLAAEKDHPNGLVAEHRSATHSSHALLLPRPVGRDELKVHRKSEPSVSCSHAPASIKKRQGTCEHTCADKRDVTGMLAHKMVREGQRREVARPCLLLRSSAGCPYSRAPEYLQCAHC